MKIKIKGYHIALVVLVIIYVLIEWYRPEPVSWERSYINSDKIPYGTYALYELLDETFPGKELEPVRLPPYNLFEDSTIGGNYLFIGPQFNIERLDLEALMTFVEAGNTAFIAAGTFSPELLDTLEVSTKMNIASADSLLRFTNPRLGTQWRYRPPVNVFSWFNAVDSLNTSVLGEDREGRAHFIKVPHGAGRFYLHSQPIMFSNYYVLRHQGHDYAFSALSYLSEGAIWWDEYYKQGRIGSQSILGIIKKYPAIRWAWYLLIFGLLLFVIFRAKRRQRIIPPVAPLTNTSLEFVDVVSSLYFNQGDFRDIALKKAGYFEEYLRTRFQEASERPHDDPAFIERLSAKSGIKKATLEALFKAIAYARAADMITETELHDLNAQIEDFYLHSL